MDSIEKFRSIAREERFKGWPLVGDPVLGEKIPYFGQPINYQLRTGNGVEDYTSIIRHFGWVVVFGMTTEEEVVTLVQWKPGVNCASWELPPGGIGKIGPETTHEQILKKTQKLYLAETGYGGGSWRYLKRSIVETGKYRGTSANDHGLPAHLLMATHLKKIADGRKPNPNEIIETLLVPLDEFHDVIEVGDFNEVSAVSCALLALRQLGR